MKINKYSLFIIFIVITLNSFAQRGKDGVKIISAANTIVNEYTSLATDANVGTTSIVVANNTLNTNNRFTASLAPGDLIMIIQVQGATIFGNNQIRQWGSVLNYNNCGLYEFAEVLSVQGSTIINISCGLANSYTASGKVVIVRIPRYQSLTVNNGGSLTVDTWNGTIGGILSVEVLGSTIINSGGKIDISGKGFRGGKLTSNNNTYGVGEYYYLTDNYGKEKGEGIAGFEADYDPLGGRFCRGAAANAGGGANVHNTGGGGGANAGDTSLWTGNGNPDTTTASWIAAWNLESAGFAKSFSSGGGRGGYSFSSSNQNALTVGPNNSLWGGDNRDNNGGLGGRPLDYSKGRIYIGGGGGAGDQDNSWSSPGANGGGIVIKKTDHLLHQLLVTAAGKKGRGKEDGVKDVLVYKAVTGPKDAAPVLGQYHYVGDVKRGLFTAVHDDTDEGNRAWYIARVKNTRGEIGVPSAAVSAIII